LRVGTVNSGQYIALVNVILREDLLDELNHDTSRRIEETGVAQNVGRDSGIYAVFRN